MVEADGERRRAGSSSRSPIPGRRSRPWPHRSRLSGVFLNPAGHRRPLFGALAVRPGARARSSARTLARSSRLAPRWRKAAARRITRTPGSRSGAFIGAAALEGRDKLTLALPPSLASLGLWIEQLVAESTGKHGKGALPVVDEPLGHPGRVRTAIGPLSPSRPIAMLPTQRDSRRSRPPGTRCCG